MNALIDAVMDRVKKTKEKKEKKKFYYNLIERYQAHIYKGIKLKLDGYTTTPMEVDGITFPQPTRIVDYKGYIFHMKTLYADIKELNVAYCTVFVETEKNGLVPILNFNNKKIIELFPNTEVGKIANEFFHNFLSISEKSFHHQVENRLNVLVLPKAPEIDENRIFSYSIDEIVKSIYVSLTAWKREAGILSSENGEKMIFEMTYNQIPFQLRVSLDSYGISLKLDTTILGTPITVFQLHESEKGKNAIRYRQTVVGETAAKFIINFSDVIYQYVREKSNQHFEQQKEFYQLFS